MATTLNGFLKNLREKTGSTSLKESRYGDAESWISTGSLALNRIISGSMKKGIPSGRVTVINGQSSTRKKFVSCINYF